MKKILLILTSAFLLLGAAPIFAAEKTVKVKTKQNYIRESDRFYSQVKATVSYDESLQVIEEKNEWLHVRYKNIEGWIHGSAVAGAGKVKYRPVILGSDIDPEAGSETHEVALAGKGFTPEVEKKMGENDPGLNYALIDEITNRETPPQKLNDFIKDGGLKFPK